uniref:carbon catabolite repressor protein 4 homolog 5-like n=1 Tax=Erigeron canadensis TaxID=72917 RepID=UPI001CB9C3CE|nr:carbon catabolite repressor protein 4 homolog 5-like [Erigeron canadensis]
MAEQRGKKRRLTLEPPNHPHTSNHHNHNIIHNSKKHIISKKRKRRRNRVDDDSRKWAFSKNSDSSSLYKDKFVFVSYNILGVENARNHMDLYSNVPFKYLNWEYRKRVLCDEIARYSPAILCFQEVDRFDDLNRILQIDGFRGIYQARTGEACDGCAIFWKDELFSLQHADTIEFKRSGLRDNVAQFCVLKMNGNPNIDDTENVKSPTSRSILVGNIHVLFNPSRGDIKLGQVRLFLAEAHRLSQIWGNIPVILGGDLNSMPQSAMYEFISSSELNILHHERKKISGQLCPLEYPHFQSPSNYSSRWSKEELQLATGNEGSSYLRHNLILKSAYHGVPASRLTRDNHGEPLATSFHSKFMGTVDYIWHTEDLVPLKVLETLPIKVLKKTGGLPCKDWGSDHLALVCELAFANDSGRILDDAT